MSQPATPNETDVELMRRVQDEDSEAFALLYDRHSLHAFRVARAVLHHSDRAEEAVQEGFLSMWRGRASYRPTAQGSFRAWAMQTVRNRAIDAARRDAAAKRPLLGAAEIQAIPDPAHGSPLEGIIRRSDAESLQASLLCIPEAQAEVIGLAYFGDLTHTEIAAELDLPEGTVKGRMRLGLEKLRDRMD